MVSAAAGDAEVGVERTFSHWRQETDSPRPTYSSSIRAVRICRPAAHRASAILDLQRDGQTE